MIKLIRRLSLSQWILVAMVAGILFGCLISSGNLSAAATGNCQQACRLGA